MPCLTCGAKMTNNVKLDSEAVAQQFIIHIDRNNSLNNGLLCNDTPIYVREQITLSNNRNPRLWELDGIVQYHPNVKQYTTISKENGLWFKFDHKNKTLTSLKSISHSTTILLSYSEVLPSMTNSSMTQLKDNVCDDVVSNKDVSVTKTCQVASNLQCSLQNIGPEIFIPITVNGDATIDALCDTGANCTLLTKYDFDFLAQFQDLNFSPCNNSAGTNASGDHIKSHGICIFSVAIGGHQLGSVEAHVCDVESSILGTNVLIPPGTKTLSFDNDASNPSLLWNLKNGDNFSSSVHLNRSTPRRMVFKIVSESFFTIPANSQAVIKCRVIDMKEKCQMLAETVPTQRLIRDTEVHILEVQSSVTVVDHHHIYPALRINHSSEPVTIRENELMGFVESVTIPHVNQLTQTTESLNSSTSHLKSDEQSSLDKLKKVYEILEVDKYVPLNERNKAIQFIKKHLDSFAFDNSDLTQTNAATFDIDIGSTKPINISHRRAPIALISEYKDQIQQGIQTGVMKEIVSSWSAPALMVKKPNGDYRLCVDYRRLNEHVKSDAYGLPNMEAMLDDLSNKSIFTTIDLLSGFWQIPVDPETQDILAFSTPFGQYTWQVMPFGIKTAPACFQRMMDKVLKKGDDEDSAYLDDVMVASHQWLEHWTSLDSLFNKLSSANLKVKASKVKLGREEVQFLGHTIAFNTLKLGTKNQKALQGLREMQPKTIKDIERLFGLLNWSRKFISNFAIKTQPITDLLKFRHKRGIRIAEFWTPQLNSLKEQLIDELLCSDTKLGIVDKD